MRKPPSAGRRVKRRVIVEVVMPPVSALRTARAISIRYEIRAPLSTRGRVVAADALDPRNRLGTPNEVVDLVVTRPVVDLEQCPAGRGCSLDTLDERVVDQVEDLAV